MASICDGPLTSVAFCWTLERNDGGGIALTSGDRQFSRGGIAYQPEPGITPAAITRSLGLQPHSAEVSGALTAWALTDSDLSLGRWDFARISMTAVDWSALDEQPIQLLGGELGEVSVSGDSFTAELKGAAAKLSAPVCPSTSAECRAEFGDKKCRVDLAGRTLRLRISSAADNLIITDQPLDERYLFGRLRYLSGANCGLQTVILAMNGTQLTVRDRVRAAVEPGTVIEVREGCDKLFATCVRRFANAVNFRGEPHVPGNDLLTRYP
jgi:uncharacterized phage protein (TIGR02218 family)